MEGSERSLGSDLEDCATAKDTRIGTAILCDAVEAAVSAQRKSTDRSLTFGVPKAVDNRQRTLRRDLEHRALTKGAAICGGPKQTSVGALHEGIRKGSAVRSIKAHKTVERLRMRGNRHRGAERYKQENLFPAAWFRHRNPP